MRRAARIDNNQSEIIAALKEKGATVLSLAPMGKGVPDLLVLYRWVLILMEVKSKGGKLTRDQIEWQMNWPGKVYNIFCIQDALNALEDAIKIKGRK